MINVVAFETKFESYNLKVCICLGKSIDWMFAGCDRVQILWSSLRVQVDYYSMEFWNGPVVCIDICQVLAHIYVQDSAAAADWCRELVYSNWVRKSVWPIFFLLSENWVWQKVFKSVRAHIWWGDTIIPPFSSPWKTPCIRLRIFRNRKNT